MSIKALGKYNLRTDRNLAKRLAAIGEDRRVHHMAINRCSDWQSDCLAVCLSVCLSARLARRMCVKRNLTKWHKYCVLQLLRNNR